MISEEQKKQFIGALSKNMGIVSLACQQAGISRSVFYNLMKKDEEFAIAVNEIKCTQADYVESKLLQRINDGDTTSIIFYLKTKGRHLGYTTRKTEDTSPTNDGMTQAEIEASELNRLNVEFEKQKKRITDLLKEEKKYTPELELQIEICAKLKVQEETLNKKLMISGYSPTITEYSREGEPRSVVNPVWRVHQDVTDQLQKALRALGMNTESKDRKSDGDTVGGFLEAFQAKSEERAAALKRLEGDE